LIGTLRILRSHTQRSVSWRLYLAIDVFIDRQFLEPWNRRRAIDCMHSTDTLAWRSTSESSSLVTRGANHIRRCNSGAIRCALVVFLISLLNKLCVIWKGLRRDVDTT
jgi:hypothetical protein